MNAANQRPQTCDVLVVEDELLQAREIEHALSRAGLVVRIARNAGEAFALAQAEQPVVAIVDCKLPDSNGFLVAKKFESMCPRTAVILMSGRIDGAPEDLMRATASRAFINKPVPLGALRQAVLKLVRARAFGGDLKPERYGWMLSGIGSPRSSQEINPNDVGGTKMHSPQRK